MRTAVAIIAAKIARRLSRWQGGGATALPGVIGLKVQPQLVAKLAGELAGTVVVTGTNGKTTTSRFLGSAWHAAGRRYVHNQAGSNLLRGIASSLALNRPSKRQRASTYGLFEVDEATMPAACTALQPDVVLVLNLFRDQLDRYGELARTAEYLRHGLEALPASSTVVLNADDPLVASLGKDLKQRVVYFGVQDPSVARSQLPHAADSLSGPDGELLEYDAVYVGHLGHYRSRSGSLVRPMPEIALEKVALDGIRGSQLTIRTGQTTVQLSLKLPGLYNAYNALAALAAGVAAGIPAETVAEAVSKTAAAFGRVEQIAVGNKTVWLGLIKNPTGTNEVIHTLALDGQPKDLLVLINDNFADGTDVSWLWDADFEELLPQLRSIRVGGTRAADMAVRLKYAGRSEPEINLAGSVGQALSDGLDAVPDGGTLYVLPTYTAMLELRRELKRRGHVPHYLD